MVYLSMKRGREGENESITSSTMANYLLLHSLGGGVFNNILLDKTLAINGVWGRSDIRSLTSINQYDKALMNNSTTTRVFECKTCNRQFPSFQALGGHRASHKKLTMCTLEKRGAIFILTLTGPDQHRLNPTLIASLRSALSQAKAQSTRGSVLITVADGKFFSNGFDLDWAQASGSLAAAQDRLVQMVDLFKPVVADLISLPMPTIAAVTGHAAAAGMLLGLSHDYVLMRRDRGVLYMSEIDIGLTLPDYFSALFRSKVASPAARRDVLLKAAKVKAEEAVAMGLIDSAHDSGDSTVEAALRLGEELAKRKWDGVVYGEIRKALYPELCGVLGLADKGIVSSRL